MPEYNPPPPFESWVDYCFTLGYSDFHREGDGSEIASREDRFLCIDPVVTSEYLCRMFDGAGELVERFTPDQLASGTWFVFGTGSGMFHEVRSPGVPADLQRDVYLKMASMYTGCFDALCGRRGTTEDDVTQTDELDGAVYMIWDMDCVECAVMFGERNGTPHLVDAGYETLNTVLRECRRPSCLISALHGLGHLVSHHPERSQSAIAAFLRERGPEIPEWVLDYAGHARTGYIQ